GRGETGVGWERVQLVWGESPIGIFAVRSRAGQPDPASLIETDAPATARLARSDPERLRIDVDATRAVRARVAVAWSPKWHATVDGRAVRLVQTDGGLMNVRLPAGGSTLELSYEPGVWDRIGVVISALELVVLATLGVLWWRARTRRATR